MQSETGFPSSHQLKAFVASKSRLKLAARCPVSGFWPSCLYSCCVLLCVSLFVYNLCVCVFSVLFLLLLFYVFWPSALGANKDIGPYIAINSTDKN